MARKRKRMIVWWGCPREALSQGVQYDDPRACRSATCLVSRKRVRIKEKNKKRHVNSFLYSFLSLAWPLSTPLSTQTNFSQIFYPFWIKLIKNGRINEWTKWTCSSSISIFPQTSPDPEIIKTKPYSFSLLNTNMQSKHTKHTWITWIYHFHKSNLNGINNVQEVTWKVKKN